MLTKEEFLRTYYGGSLLHKLVDHSMVKKRFIELLN